MLREREIESQDQGKYKWERGDYGGEERGKRQNVRFSSLWEYADRLVVDDAIDDAIDWSDWIGVHTNLLTSAPSGGNL